ncbi:hypothetical protein CONPUDRAFT_84757 [Coniophora puteana RWD-64-598 SS2]|uniref:Uncharacterized protein n=1 Tax=Coniophora puteana (strain RWD-64-598) TaxID=741705 RepID=A0A5M3MCF4_CONPW|nr:uncharacterized protein CONPUDRAFT_84757 [Coniophora puteana RWD-64-598 SS2]EIW76932.1 hypothetical protein CONPUDRAFT_84757 [Coniophora puteana RWD-64-598 SS2]
MLQTRAQPQHGSSRARVLTWVNYVTGEAQRTCIHAVRILYSCGAQLLWNLSEAEMRRLRVCLRSVPAGRVEVFVMLEKTVNEVEQSARGCES